uniref:Uncharacterized protein n=1 Tax=Candidatus Kentrum sp. SD TaxID=2126332 RepID=A0A450YAV3_9GAMM|nr:MAG: hypothetical protein BECKSD772F_GA0070984_100177 [Candidatus Kentron sp. SD]VFK38680.1 MAG: hypothetical protein BECKSD772E_GA0070983_100176 [Candidatus Kentron sp. SD]
MPPNIFNRWLRLFALFGDSNRGSLRERNPTLFEYRWNVDRYHRIVSFLAPLLRAAFGVIRTESVHKGRGPAGTTIKFYKTLILPCQYQIMLRWFGAKPR